VHGITAFDMPQPPGKPPDPTREPSVRSKAWAAIVRQGDVLSFVRWWLLLFLLCLAITLPLKVALNLSGDTVALLVVGTPIAGAATMAIVGRRAGAG